MHGKLYHGDCFQVANDAIEDGAASLAFVDPPYNIGIFKKMPAGEYLEWCEKWIALCSRKLKANGAFWVSHSKPDVLVDISRIIEKYGRKRINWVTWDKYNGASAGQQYVMNRTKLHPQGKRAYDQDAEYLIYHADEGKWTAQCDKERGFIFEPLRDYLEGERKRAGIDKIACNVACGFSASAGGMASRHYFSRSQWCLPTPKHYEAMRQLFNHNSDDEYLRREYEDLRQEFESLRYTFNNPGKVSSVWQIPPASKNDHPTPKPKELLRRTILATSNEGDLVFDPMMGSGTTGVICAETGRDFVGIEADAGYFRLAQRLIGYAQNEAQQLGLL